MSMMRLKLFNYHKWTGATILLLAALRLLWRLTHRPPADLPAPQVAARAPPRSRTGRCTRCSSPCRWWAGPTARRRAFRSWCSACCRCPISCPRTTRWPRRSSPARRPGLGAGRARRAARGRRRQAHGHRPRRPAAPHDARPRLSLHAIPLPKRSPMNKIRTALVLAASLALTGVAFAQAKVVPAQSQITFAIKEMGVPVEGRFAQVDGRHRVRPEEARDRQGGLHHRHRQRVVRRARDRRRGAQDRPGSTSPSSPTPLSRRRPSRPRAAASSTSPAS